MKDKPGGVVECSCGLVAMRRLEREEQVRRERTEKYLTELRASLGKLADCTFQTLNASRPLLDCSWDDQPVSHAAQKKSLSQAIAVARLYAAQPDGWLYIYGPTGAGKSHLAAAIANDLLQNNQAVSYGSVPDILSFVRKGMNDQTAEDRFAGLQSVEVLILDDLGTENVTSWSIETLFRLIDERDKHARPTVITSNLHYDSLSPRIASRIAGMVRVVPMLVSDYRRLPR